MINSPTLDRGSTLSRAVHIDDEVTARIAKASVAFGRRRANDWERNGTKHDTKLNDCGTANSIVRMWDLDNILTSGEALVRLGACKTSLSPPVTVYY